MLMGWEVERLSQNLTQSPITEVHVHLPSELQKSQTLAKCSSCQLLFVLQHKGNDQLELWGPLLSHSVWLML